MTLHEIIKTLRDIPVEYIKSQRDLRWSEFTTPIMARENSVTWMGSEQYTRAGCIITNKKIDTDATQIITEHPHMVFNLLMKKFSAPKPETVIDPSAIIDPGAVLGRLVNIGANAIIGKCYIGDMTTIYPRCYIGNGTHIGKRCEIGHGAVIGTDAFEYDNYDGKPFKIYPQCHVYIGDDVRIGANTCINRGILADTVIFNNVKIGNLCHINHEVRIEENTVIEPRSVIEKSIDRVKKIPVSILIPAFKAKYIGETLGSIEKQSYFTDNDEYEVLIGIDGCRETLTELEKIRGKYRNLRIFMMKDNRGPYVTLNTLAGLSRYRHILPFGADDIMKPEMIGEMMAHGDFDMVKCFFYNFHEDNVRINRYASHGIMLLKKSLLRRAGGWQPWRCSADTEFMKRVTGHSKVYEIKAPLFLRRIHPESLTQNKDTGTGSEIRKTYYKQIRVYSDLEDIKIEKAINEHTKIGKRNKIAICIPIYKRYEITDFVLKYYKNLRNQLKNDMDLVLICAGSEGKTSQKLAKKNGFLYVERENHPLSQKVNALYEKAGQLGVDACIKVDSDSIILKEFFFYYDDLIDKGYDYSGIEDIYFLVQNYLCYWAGYKNKRKGETTGVGRFLSKRLLQELDWRPWGDLQLEMGLDTNLQKRVKKLDIRQTKTSCSIIDGIAIDLKSNDMSITSFDRCSFDKVLDLKDMSLDLDFTSINDHLLKKDRDDIKIW